MVLRIFNVYNQYYAYCSGGVSVMYVILSVSVQRDDGRKCSDKQRAGCVAGPEYRIRLH